MSCWTRGPTCSASEAILYHLLASKPPYDRGNPYKSHAAAATGEAIRAPTSLVGGIPKDLEAICLKACAIAPHDRFENGGEMAALRDWLDGAQRRERAMKLVDGAEALRRRMVRQQEEVRRLREEGDALLADLPDDADEEALAPGWEKQDAARALEREIDGLRVEFIQHLRAALTHAPELPEAQGRLADLYRARHAAAEKAGDHEAAAEMELYLRAHDDGG